MATATEAKPKTPYPEFLLFAHQNGQWEKKSKGNNDSLVSGLILTLHW